MAAGDGVLIGRWRIVQSDLWGPDDLDLLGPAMIAFDDRGHGEITVGALTASLRLEYARTTVFFRWHGSDDMTEVSGEGSAELQDDGTIEIEVTYHDGDDVILKAVREPTSSTACYSYCVTNRAIHLRIELHSRGERAWISDRTLRGVNRGSRRLSSGWRVPWATPTVSRR